MNVRKLVSSFGVGLVFVAVLSMFVVPVLAMEEEAGYIERWYYKNALTWHAGLYAGAWYDDYNVITDYNWNIDVWNAEILRVFTYR